jgi:hypothetical protein
MGGVKLCDGRNANDKLLAHVSVDHGLPYRLKQESPLLLPFEVLLLMKLRCLFHKLPLDSLLLLGSERIPELVDNGPI